jgi:aryl-alcohol dehydrogenase-like predicted oxidoreductase
MVCDELKCRWVMDAGDGATVHPIVGLRGTEHIADNARVLAMPPLTSKEVERIAAILERARGPSGDIYSFERGS